MTTIQNAQQGIQITLDKFMQAWNRHDAKAFAALFTKDADFTNVFGQNFVGREAIEAQHVRIFSTIFKASRMTKMEKRIKLIQDDLASVDVFWSMAGAADMTGNQWPERKGLLILFMKRENNNWSIDIFHNMDLPALPAN